MRTRVLILFFSLFGLFLIPAQAQFNYTSNSVNHTATLTGYTGSGGAVSIPSTVTFGSTVYSVTAIGPSAFENTSITSVTISDTVTNIGDNAFDQCPDITNFTVAASNTAFSSTKGVLFSMDQTTI